MATFPECRRRFLGVGVGSPVPVSTVGDVRTSIGLASGDFRPSNTFSGQDTSTSFSEQTSFELRFNSQFNGPFNFMVAGSTFDFESQTDYFVRAPGLDYYSLVAPVVNPDLAPVLAELPPPPEGSFTVFGPGYFNNETPEFELDSWAVFGEGYYESQQRR
ncbi:MAG: hypothetical protein U5Q16_14010 [Gammaproteobacteria bacterium]|nr:hypothetical protein [Gammaproteobacteria bacterium]